MTDRTSMTRRSFLTLSACCVGLGLVGPCTALANESANSKSPDEDWAIAERRALEEGSTIEIGSVSDEELRNLASMPMSCSLLTIVASSDYFMHSVVFRERLQAVLVADHSSSSTVGTFKNTWIQMSYCEVSNLTYKRTTLDGGKTQAVSYVFTARDPLTTYSGFKCYCEFYYTGTGRMCSWSYV